jgi:hypothetical protein
MTSLPVTQPVALLPVTVEKVITTKDICLGPSGPAAQRPSPAETSPSRPDSYFIGAGGIQVMTEYHQQTKTPGHGDNVSKCYVIVIIGDTPANSLVNQGGYGHTTRAPPGVSLPSGSRARNLQILDPAFKPLRCSGDTYSECCAL